MKKLSRWFFLLRGQPFAYGPIGPMTKADAKESIKQTWGTGNRMPYGTQMWRE